jgi:hypothetical protein
LSRSDLCVAIVAVALAAAPAAAQDPRAVKRVEDLNRAAMEDYDLLELDSARKQLADALAMIKKHRLERHKVAARTHLNLAIVHGGGLGDQETALQELTAALEIDPDTKLEAAYRSPALQKTFEQARASVLGNSGAAAPAPAPLSAALTHTPVEEARAGEPLAINVKLGGELVDRATQLVLRYRPSGAETFGAVSLRAAGGGEFQGVIPESATRGDTVHYFVEARAATGKVLASAGNVDAPHIVSLIRPPPSAAPRGEAGDLPGDEENPLSRGAPPAGAGSGDGGEDGTTEVRRSAAPRRRFSVAVGVGSGVGYIGSGETEVMHQPVTCCLAWAPLHVLPELSYWITSRFSLGVVGRIGFPLGADVEGAATLGPSVFARATYLFGEGGGAYVHGDLGGGYIRHTIKLSSSSGTDTFVTGPLLVAAGGGWIQPLGTSGLRFIVDVNLIAGIPVIDRIGSGARASEPGFALHGDLSLGMGFAF